ncbi:hypothetical protein [Aeromonas phage SW69-9]|nr:hypothetical protein [Aeromonas phage SW69-9]
MMIVRLNPEEGEIFEKPGNMNYPGIVRYDAARMNYYYVKDGIRHTAASSRNLRKGIHVEKTLEKIYNPYVPTQKVKVEKMAQVSSQLQYEDLNCDVRVVSSEYANANARDLAKYSKLSSIADIVEVSSQGINTDESYWKTSSSGYKALASIPPVVCFEDPSAATKFCELVKSMYPNSCAKQFLELEFGRLSMNDVPSNVTKHMTWPESRGAFYIITVVHIGNGVEFGVRSVTGRDVSKIFNSTTSAGRVELFVDYCRRTASKK